MTWVIMNVMKSFTLFCLKIGLQVSNLGKAGIRESKLQEKEQKKLEREKQKQLKEQMKQQAEFEKSKKRLMQETIKNSRPGECLKVSN